MSDFVLKKPQRGETSSFSPDNHRRLILDFDSAQSTLEREDNNLVMKFEDQSRIVLNDFYTAYNSQNMPSFLMQGVEVEGKDFFAALGEELKPAAGHLQRFLSGGSIVGTESGQLLSGGVDASEGLNSSTSRFTSVRSAIRSLFDREESNDLSSVASAAGFTLPADGVSGKENDFALFDALNPDGEAKAELSHEDLESIRATVSGDIEAKGADGVNAEGFFVTSIGGVTFGADGKGEGTFTVESRYGNEDLVLTRDGNTITAQTDSFFMPETYFTLTLNQDGTWEMKQFVDFALPHESKTFDMVVSAEDKYGDVASLTVNIDPFEPAGIVVVEPAEVNVDEAHLADGTNPDAAALVKTGAVTVTAPDGLTEIALQDFDQNPVLAKWDSTTSEWIFAQPQATDYGTIAIESITGIAEEGYSVNYKYTFSENAFHVWGKENDDISLRFSDRADSYKYADIDINVVDGTLVLFDALNPDGEAKAELPYEGLESSYDEIRATASGDIDAKGADGINTDGMYVKSLGGVTFDENGQGVGVFTVEGAYGDKNLVLTRDGDTITAKTDSWFMPETYFTLTLNEDGTWTMQQMEDFSLKDSTTFDMVVGGVDKDGDAAEVTVKIDPFEAAGITITKEADDLAPDESNLADGTNPDADALVKTGTVGVSAPDGLVQIVAQDYNTNPTIATWDSATDTWSFTSFNTDYGTFVITSMTGDAENGYTFTYQYTLNENADYYGNDSLGLQFKDKAGEYKSEYVSINIVDDAPLDPEDMDVTFAPDAAVATTTFELNFGADNDDKTIEINGLKVQYDAETNSWENYYSWDDDVIITKDGDITTLDFGDVTLTNDGSNKWTATFDELEHGQTITKTITIEDGDYDKQSFDIKATWDAPVEVGTAQDLTVDEAHLATGTEPDADTLTQSGSVTVTAKDGLSVITLGNGADAPTLATWNEAESKWDYAPAVSSGLGMVAIASITGSAEAGYTVNYSYTLGQNTLGESGSDSFVLGFKDSDTENSAETGSVNVNVNITDDGMILFDALNPDNNIVTLNPDPDYDIVATISGKIEGVGADGMDGSTLSIKSIDGITFDADGKAVWEVQGSYGSEKVYLTLEGNTLTAKDSIGWATYFTVTLNEDGTWNMVQSEEFGLLGGATSFDLVIGAKDKDGDEAELTMKIDPFEPAGMTVVDLADITVSESNLADGTNPDASALVKTGFVSVTATDGLYTIDLQDFNNNPNLATWDRTEGKWVFSEAVETEFGTIVVTSVEGNAESGYTVNYEYNFKENSTSPWTKDDDVSFKFTDMANTVEYGDLDIDIVDDELVLFDADNGEGEVKATPTGDFFTIATASGDIDVQGADGISDAGIYLKSFGDITFDESGMPSNTFTVMSKYGSEIELTLVLDGNTIKAGKGQYYFDEYFAFTLNDDGTWNYEQYYEFDMPNGATSFDIVAGAVDNDGDHAELAVKVDPFKSAGIKVESETLDSKTTLYEANLENGTAPDADALVKSGSMNISAPDGLASVKVDLFNYYSSPIATWNKDSETWELSEDGMDFGYGNVRIDSILGNAKDGYTVNFTYTMTETADHPYGDTTESIWLEAIS